MDGLVTAIDLDEGSQSKPSEPGTDLVLRSTLEEILGWRGRTLQLADEAREQHRKSLEAMRETQQMAGRAGGFIAKLVDYIENKHDNQEEFATKVRLSLDRSIWGHLLQISGIQGLMDRQALSEFERQLATDPPEVTADNVRATFSNFKKEAHRIFRRGLVNAFVELDRTYRSHDGFKIGNRLVRSYALSDWGSIYDSEASLRDVDRIMHVLDGHKIVEGWTSPLTETIKTAIRGSSLSGIVAGTITTQFWHAKWFKNRNLHLYPMRKDLVRRANRLIAEHFGEEAIGAGPDAAGARQYHRPKPYHHDVEDFYQTPADVAQQMVSLANLQPGHEVLEPSAGEGAIVTAILRQGLVPDCVEIDPDRADTLRDMLPPGTVINMDFLSMGAEPEYDRVIMNPPFGKGAGVQHVFHAARFLKPGGRLVAVLGAGLLYREDGPSKELRGLIAAWRGSTWKLPPGSFRPSGTDVETVVVAMTAPGGALPNETAKLALT